MFPIFLFLKIKKRSEKEYDYVMVGVHDQYDEKGYKKAFIVPFINNKKALLETALEIEKNIK